MEKMKYTINQLFEYTREIFPLDKFPEREEEMVRIMIHILDISRYELSLIFYKILQDDELTSFNNIIQERQTGKPLAHILGYTYFYQDKIPVSPQTLIPRYDTEHLIEVLRKHYVPTSEISILDIGTGTGAIAISLHRLFPLARVKGIDIIIEPFIESQKDLELDSSLLTIEQVDFLDESTWEDLGKWDCIVSNPPYLDNHDMDILDWQVKDFEPHTALYAGDDGLIFYRKIAKFAEDHLHDDGILVLEIDHKHEAISQCFDPVIFPYRDIKFDFNNLERVLILKKAQDVE
jgi:release factor glutamine methyltransferase